VSKNVAMFVDVANLYYAARGQDVDVDYVALLKHATKGRDLIRAYAYSGLDPENENQRKFIDFLAKNGYKPVVKDIRKFGDGRVKANLDIELVVDLFRLEPRMDIAVIVSGDGDFAPAIRALQDTGVRCEVVSFKPNTSSDLIAVADEFFDIMKIASISRKRGEGSRAESAGMATPEMPAKEVVPEFGFREASPAVAAAALAAMKTGGPSRTPARARRSRGGAEAADEAQPATTVPSALVGDDDQPRRRRRRRGGRGRGRGRPEGTADALVPVGPVGEPGEIGWEELDDLSQLEGVGEEHEYGFEEADEATLRELGLLDATGAAPAAITDAEQAPSEPDEVPEKPRTRRRSTRAAAAASEAPDAPTVEAEAPKPRRRAAATRGRAAADETPTPPPDAEAAEPKPRARRTARSRAKAEPSGEAAEGAADVEKPKRRRSTPRTGTTRAAMAESGTKSEGDEEPQGIWGRFRSGRSTRGS